MKNISVPQGMLEAAMESRKQIEGQVVGWSEGMCRQVLEAAVSWLIEHPIVPNDEEARGIIETVFADPPIIYSRPGDGMPGSTITVTREQMKWPRLSKEQEVFAEWQRQMFLAPEQENDPDPEKTRYREALEKLAKLGNGDAYGNSTGNTIAQEALGMDKRSPAPEQEDELEGYRQIIDKWLKELQPDGSRVVSVGSKCAGDLVEAIESYRRGKKSASPAPPQDNPPDPIIEIMERRMAEYSNWVHRNLQNLFDKKPLEPRLDWDKPGKLSTYADVVKK